MNCSNSFNTRIIDTDIAYTGESFTCGDVTVNTGDSLRKAMEVLLTCQQDVVIAVSGSVLPVDVEGKKVAFVGSGTFTQTGGPDIVVPDGSMGILFWDGSEWSLSQSVEMPVQVADGEIVEGDDRAVSGDTVYKNTVSNRAEVSGGDSLTLGYYDLTGDEPSIQMSSTTTSSGVFNVEGFDTLELEYTRGGIASRAYAFVDKDNKIIERADESKIITDKETFNIPEYAVEVYVNTSHDSNPDFIDKFKLSLIYDVQKKFDSLVESKDNFDEFLKISLTDSNDIDIFNDGYYDLSGNEPSGLLGSSITKSTIIDVTGVDEVTLIRVRGGMASRAYAFVDEDGYIIERADENDHIDFRVVDVPDGAVKMYINATRNDPQGWLHSQVRVNLKFHPFSLVDGDDTKLLGHGLKAEPFLPSRYDGYTGDRNTYSLAGVDVALVNNMYVTKGYLFTEYPDNNGKLFYSNSVFREPDLIANFGGATGNINQFAISPKHRSVIRAVYDGTQGNNLRVFENDSYNTIEFTEPCYGWLYNFGHTFFEDGNGDEFFIFGEYSHSRTPTRRIIKASYPYSDQSNWEVVHTFDSNNDIHHIHQLIKDPYTDYLYCFTGDSASESNIYYSDDFGDSWSLLAQSTDVGGGTDAVIRATNVHFFEDYVIYASDDDYHVLVEIKKDSNGLLDIDTLNILAVLQSGQMTNGSYLCREKNVLYMMDRVRLPDSTLVLDAYKIDTGELIRLAEFKQSSYSYSNLWGHRGRTYIVYPNNTDRVFGFGISNRIPLQIKFAENNNGTYGGLYYKF